MKFFLKFMSVILVIIFIVWGIPMLKCEYLTAQHGHEFSFEDVEENTMLSKPDWFRILSYNDEYAEIYYICEGFGLGEILSFKKVDGEWIFDDWVRDLWTAFGGNGDEIVWPYFWHYDKYR